jgi:hypothetical protein
MSRVILYIEWGKSICKHCIIIGPDPASNS